MGLRTWERNRQEKKYGWWLWISAEVAVGHVLACIATQTEFAVDGVLALPVLNH